MLTQCLSVGSVVVGGHCLFLWSITHVLELHFIVLFLCYPFSLPLFTLFTYSTVGKDDKHTREGYKTSHKRKAFSQIEVIASDMNIHMQVAQKAEEE